MYRVVVIVVEYVRTYVFVYIRMYVRMYLCTYVCMYVCMYVCTYVQMYQCTYVCVYDIVEAHCYFVDIGRTDREQIRSRINNNDCRTFRPRRPLSTVRSVRS